MEFIAGDSLGGILSIVADGGVGLPAIGVN